MIKRENENDNFVNQQRPTVEKGEEKVIDVDPC